MPHSSLRAFSLCNIHLQKIIDLHQQSAPDLAFFLLLGNQLHCPNSHLPETEQIDISLTGSKDIP
jgi:hypothetical protein